MRLPTWVVSIRSVLRFIAILRLLSFVSTADASQGTAREPKTTARARGPALSLLLWCPRPPAERQSEARSPRKAGSTACRRGGPSLHGQQAVTVHPLARALS